LLYIYIRNINISHLYFKRHNSKNLVCQKRKKTIFQFDRKLLTTQKEQKNLKTEEFEESGNLARYRSKNIFVTDYQNNYVET